MSEQERADALARDLDRLLAGERLPEGDPLLEVASLLSRLPLQPGEQAAQRFEQRLDEWFGRPAPPTRRPIPVVAAALVIALVLILIIALAILTNRPVGVPTPAETNTATISPTASPSMLPSPTPSAPSTSATQQFSRVIVAGPIDSLQGSVMVILGQPIQVTGGLARLCAGDLVRVAVILNADGTFQADRSAIVVESSACGIGPAPGGQGSNGRGAKRGGRGDDDDHDHDD